MQYREKSDTFPVNGSYSRENRTKINAFMYRVTMSKFLITLITCDFSLFLPYFPSSLFYIFNKDYLLSGILARK